MIKFFIKKIKLKLLNREWRKQNTHNLTTLKKQCRFDLISVGIATYGSLDIETWGAENEKLIIGNYCSIASGVKFILGGNHQYNTITTYPFKVKKYKIQTEEAYSKGPIILEDDVWIGLNAMILSGITIGKGAIIGAGAVVTRNIPPYSIVVGNPAKVIKKRFSDEVIDFLIQQDFSNIDFNEIQLDDLYRAIDTVSDAKRILNR